MTGEKRAMAPARRMVAVRETARQDHRGVLLDGERLSVPDQIDRALAVGGKLP